MENKAIEAAVMAAGKFLADKDGRELPPPEGEDYELACACMKEAIEAYEAAKWKGAATEKPSNSRPVQTKILCRYKRYKPQARKQGYPEGRWQVFNGYGWSNASEEITEWAECEKKEARK